MTAGRWDRMMGGITRTARGYDVVLGAWSPGGTFYRVALSIDATGYARWLPEILDQMTRELERAVPVAEAAPGL